MASQSCTNINPFSMTNDQIIRKVYEAHIPGDESCNAEALFNVLANILKSSTQIAETDPTKSDVPIELAKDKPLPDNLTVAFCKIKQIGYQMTSDPACNLDHAHQTTMKILYELERFNWGTKAAIALGAFAVEYGNLLYLAEIQATPVPLGKSLAVLLKGGFILNRFQVVEMKKQAFAELNNLAKKVLKVTEYIIELEKLSDIGNEQGNASKLLEAIQEIPINVYWIIISITTCLTYIGYLKGDSCSTKNPIAFDRNQESQTMLQKKIKDGSNGDVACNSYDLYGEDIGILKEMNADAYRFSISWSRIIPTGKRSDGISKDGIDYYNNIIKLVLDKGLIPFVTLYHVNRPRHLEEEYGGFLSRSIVDDFRDFADLCFERFGDRVKHWITLNEPYTYCYTGYVVGSMAPGRCSCSQDKDCLGGDSGKEPYQVAHNLLLAHAAAFKVYKDNYKESQKGMIGITLDSLWAVPYSPKDKDKEAASRTMDFVLGWFMEPLTTGDYPKAMSKRVNDRLPKFCQEESAQLKGSFEFLGLNYYTSKFAANYPNCNDPPSYITDTEVNLSDMRQGTPIGEPTASGMYIYPEGLANLLCYIKDNYNNPLIYITENGMADYDRPIKESLKDDQRVRYHNGHLYYALSAIKDHNVNLKGYFAWSLLDNFEWALGYTLRFGMHYVEFGDDKKPRTAKDSAKWFKKFLEN